MAALHPCIKAGNVAVLTGSASGIGLAMAKTLAGHGMSIVLADRDQAALTKVVENEFSGKGQHVLAVKTDVSVAGEMENLCEVAFQKWGRVDLLHLNAGVSLPTSSFGGSLENWHKILDVNLFGVLNGTHAFVPRMLEGRTEPGAVIITGSKQGMTCPPGNPAYNVSKAGVKALAEQLAHELRNKGDLISAHLLVPGWTFTGMTKGGHTTKPDGAWTPQQVVDYAMPRIARKAFYMVCPDNSVDTPTDKARIEWSLGDIIEDRPALSRWHKDYETEFAQFMKERTGK